MEIVGKIDASTELQRYIDFAKFVDMLDTRKLFLSRVSCFEDQLEGGLTPTYIMVSSGMANLLSQAVCSLPSATKLTEEERAESEAHKNKLNNDYENRTYNTVFGRFPHSEVEHGTVFKQHRHWVDVSCWHANKTESMAMWKIYGGSTSSVCIITNVERLSRSVVKKPEYELVLSPVHYISHGEGSFQEYHGLAPLMHKSEFYSFENEVRLLTYNPNADLLSERPDNDLGTVVDINLGTLIQEIRVAHDAPEWFFKLVKSITKKYNIDANVIRSKMSQAPIFEL
ncbi:DUF2971 domain-containing protein [Vibrio astriarenae]